MSGMAAAATLASGRRVETAPRTPRRPTVDGKRLGTIFNNDINNILWATSGDATTAAEYPRGRGDAQTARAGHGSPDADDRGVPEARHSDPRELSHECRGFLPRHDAAVRLRARA